MYIFQLNDRNRENAIVIIRVYILEYPYYYYVIISLHVDHNVSGILLICNNFDM